MSGSGTIDTLNEKLTGQRNLIEKMGRDIYWIEKFVNNVRKYQLKI